MTVNNIGDSFLNAPLFERIIKEKLSTCVTSHSWVTSNLNRFLVLNGLHNILPFFQFSNHFTLKTGFEKNFVTHIGRIYEIYPFIVGVSPNYLETTFADDFEETLLSSDSGLNIVEELYTPRGS